jgi:hypothetical protein
MKTIRIRPQCPNKECGSIRLSMLSEAEKWDRKEQRHIKVGRFECLACGMKFHYAFGIDEE